MGVIERDRTCPHCGGDITDALDASAQFASRSPGRSRRPEHHALTPRPGWTQEQEYIALSEEFFAVEEDRDRLAEQLRGAVEAAREQIKALIMAQSAAGYVETAGWALLLDEIDKLPTPEGQ